MSGFTPPPSPPIPPLRQEAPGATAGLVLGILSIVASFPILGLIFAWIGFSKSKEAKMMCESYPHLYSNGGMATAGYVCSIVGLVLGGLSTLGCCVYIGIVGLIMAGAAGSGGF